MFEIFHVVHHDISFHVLIDLPSAWLPLQINPKSFLNLSRVEEFGVPLHIVTEREWIAFLSDVIEVDIVVRSNIIEWKVTNRYS